ncbi:MAG: sulfatase-like hydrolase/transferase [Fibrobacterales bacterium]
MKTKEVDYMRAVFDKSVVSPVILFILATTILLFLGGCCNCKQIRVVVTHHDATGDSLSIAAECSEIEDSLTTIYKSWEPTPTSLSQSNTAESTPLPKQAVTAWEDAEIPEDLAANYEDYTIDPAGKIPYNTEYVVILVIDGVRWSESWGDPTFSLIQNQAHIMKQRGVFNKNFYNDGVTETVPGHTALTTGNYQKMNNHGKQLPKKSSIFQHWRKAFHKKKSDAYILATKGKLAVLGSSLDPKWRGKYEPKTYCGVNGKGVKGGYSNDKAMMKKAFKVLRKYHPQLSLITLYGPDYWGHKKKWKKYVKAIEETDEMVLKLLNHFQTDPFYKGKTTVFLTNDHGRHLKGHKNGFHSHGDNCDGCKHLSFMAFGPDFKQDVEVSTRRDLIDIPATIEELMGFDVPHVKGDIMTELFLDKYQSNFK